MRQSSITVITAVLSISLLMTEAWAARMSGGRSMGRQSSHVSQKTPPAAPAQQQASQQAQKPADQRMNSASTQKPTPTSPWKGILGGLAVGLGLAWLASSLGLGAGMGSTLLIMLLVLAAGIGLMAWMRRRTPVLATAGTYSSPAAASPGSWSNQRQQPYPYPTGSSHSSINPSLPTDSIIGSALPSSATHTWSIPDGFDVNGFLDASKTNFMRLQAAWDKGNKTELRALMTDELLNSLDIENAPARLHDTQIHHLEAELLGVEESEYDYLASVRFSGSITENPFAGPVPIREVWNISRPKNGFGGWMIAGIQTVQ